MKKESLYKIVLYLLCYIRRYNISLFLFSNVWIALEYIITFQHLSFIFK